MRTKALALACVCVGLWVASAHAQTLTLILDGLYWDNTSRELRVGNRETLPISGIDASGTGDIIIRRQDDHAKFRVSTYGSTGQNWIACDKARGTVTSPAAMQAGDVFCSMVGVGYPGSGTFQHGPEMIFRATEAWTDTSRGAAIEFYSVVEGTTGQVQTLRLINGVAQLPQSAGAGSAYACFDSSGKLYRSGVPCV